MYDVRANTGASGYTCCNPCVHHVRNRKKIKQGTAGERGARVLCSTRAARALAVHFERMACVRRDWCEKIFTLAIVHYAAPHV